MEFYQVKYFLTLAETLNFTRAAEACNVTQPALTRAMQKLEEELGGLLFHRERSLTHLTELGQVMLPLLGQTSAAALAAKEQARAFKRRDSAPLRLALDHSIPAALLTPLLSELSRRIKGLELTMRQSSSPEIGRQLLAGESDVGLVVGCDKLPERLNRWDLYEEGLVVLCPAGHRLCGLAEVPLAVLAEERMLRRDVPDCAVAAALEALCSAAGVELQIQHGGAPEEFLHEMVKASLGLVVAAERQPVPRGLVARRLALPDGGRSVVLTAVAGRQHGTGVAAFLKLARSRDWSEGQAEAAA